MRKTKEITISGVSNRDAGKTYVLTEMPALQAEKWAVRAFLAMDGANIAIPPEVRNLGIVGIALVSMQAWAGAKFENVDPLLDDMMTCVAIRTGAGVTRPAGGQDDIEEVSTLFRLRKELLELHTGFTFAEIASKLTPVSAAPTGSPNTAMSPA